MHPGHTDEWCAALTQRLAHYARGDDMSTAPDLPDE
jgi:hypothetical protein